MMGSPLCAAIHSLPSILARNPLTKGKRVVLLLKGSDGR